MLFISGKRFSLIIFLHLIREVCAKVAERHTRLTADQLYPGSNPGLGFFGIILRYTGFVFECGVCEGRGGSLMNWEYVIEGIVIGVSAGVAIQVVNLASKKFNFRQEEKAIVDFLKKSSRSSRYTPVSSTIIICNAVNLPEERVRYICNRSKEIQRTEQENESWTLK